jgi:hypothetical protein
VVVVAAVVEGAGAEDLEEDSPHPAARTERARTASTATGFRIMPTRKHVAAKTRVRGV